MACVRKRRGKYVVDWRDGAGIRHWKGFDRKGDAEAFRTQVAPLASQRRTPTVPVNITLAQYAADHWMTKIHKTRKRSTAIRYQQVLTQHLLPALGPIKLRTLTPAQIEHFLLTKLGTGTCGKRTVAYIHAVLRSLLHSAMKPVGLRDNAACDAAKDLQLTESTKVRRAHTNIKAMDAWQRQAFLTTAARLAPHDYPLFFTLAGTGMRLGEALALQWDDLRLHKREIEIVRALSEHREADETDTPKSGCERTVDCSTALVEVLVRHVATHRATSPWVFATATGAPLDAYNVRHTMRSLLTAANLPRHFSPHCLRHTYASLMLQQGESLKYVQGQLGHSSIQLTADVYGDWLPTGNKAAVDRLDSVTVPHSGSKTVANLGYLPTCAGRVESVQPLDRTGYCVESATQQAGISREMLVRKT